MSSDIGLAVAILERELQRRQSSLKYRKWHGLTLKQVQEVEADIASIQSAITKINDTLGVKEND